jgi:hypothetical protein
MSELKLHRSVLRPYAEKAALPGVWWLCDNYVFLLWLEMRLVRWLTAGRDLRAMLCARCS